MQQSKQLRLNKAESEWMRLRIENIGTPVHNNWLAVLPSGILAVDTGLLPDCGGFLRRFSKRHALSLLKWVFVTHAHCDHSAFCAQLLESTGAELYMSENTFGYLQKGKYDSPGYEYTNALGKILRKTERGKAGKLGALQKCERVHLLKASGQSAAFGASTATMIPLPGHTADSCGLYFADENVLFCGDAAINISPLNKKYHCVLIEDVQAAYKSWDKIIAINPRLIFSGHGKPFGPGKLAENKYLIKPKAGAGK
jgi:glyoxylase-like metal-dependent hydrolase (beta-lactamase superfamily II)